MLQLEQLALCTNKINSPSPKPESGLHCRVAKPHWQLPDRRSWQSTICEVGDKSQEDRTLRADVRASAAYGCPSAQDAFGRVG